MIKINNFANYIASLFGLGYKTKFPGTLGSIAGWIFSFLAFYFFHETVYIILFVLFLALGFWAISHIQKDTEKKDYSWIIIDEWIGIWFVGFLWFDVHNLLTIRILAMILAFVVFRLIDIFKCIPPIQTIDAKENQTASSIILDDVIAGVYTYVIILILFNFYNIYSLWAALLFLVTPMIANAVPVLLRRVPLFDTPINRKLFGQNKTWRGFVGGTIAGILGYFILIKLLLLRLGSHEFPNVRYTLLTGFLLSFGALAGDLIKSFFKRRAGIADGASWILWDQIDYVLGAIIFTFFIFHYYLSGVVLYLIVGGMMSALAHRFSYLVKLINTKS